MKNYFLLIDGPKGSGKSTLLELLKEKLSNTEFLSFDTLRKNIEKTDSREADNEKAFQLVVEKLKDTLREGKNVIIDSGVSEKRVSLLDEIAKEYNVPFYKFSLTAPYAVLLSRVEERDKQKGKIFDKDRFDFVLQVQQAKSFEDFFVIDSSKFSPQEIGEIVCSTIVSLS